MGARRGSLLLALPARVPFSRYRGEHRLFLSACRLAAPGVIVDAVEPDPTNVRVLRSISGPTKCRGRCGPLRSTTGLGVFFSRTMNTIWEIFGPATSRSSDSLSSPKWVVPAASGDELFAEKSFDLVKIDTQGWEFEILLGLRPHAAAVGQRQGLSQSSALRSCGTAAVTRSRSWPDITSWGTQITR